MKLLAGKVESRLINFGGNTVVLVRSNKTKE